MQEEKDLVPIKSILEFFTKKKVKLPEVTEPIAEVFSPRRAKGEIKLEFEEQDLKISNEIVPKTPIDCQRSIERRFERTMVSWRISFLS